MNKDYGKEHWTHLLQNCCNNGDDIRQYLNLTDDETARINKISKQYPMCINHYYLSLIDPGDPEDPIRKMSIPSGWELSEGGELDTSGEASNTVIPGMQHKYDQTTLILSTNMCAMYCRHCFRKRLVGLSDDEIAGHLGEMEEYVRTHPEVSNVLITGGDAFLNSNQRIKEYLERFIDIPHLDLIRFGTRTPVVLPQRITTDAEIQQILEDYNKRKQIYVITQFNHPREVTDEAVEAIRILQKIGIVIKNQTVLLKGINSDPAVLGSLLKRLTACGVVPYYIFQCRPVRGVLNHFQVPLKEGSRIVEEAKTMQNGQGKCLHYAMSHPTGKIEILGQLNGEVMLFRYHQAKNSEEIGRIFTVAVREDQCWLDMDLN